MNNNGFTLIELVVVILVLSILAVTVYPNLSASSGFSAITERDQVISLLKTAQQRAMQNTEASDCQAVYFSGNQIGIAQTDAAGACVNNFAAINSTKDYLRLNLENTLAVVGSAGLIEFNNWGNPANAVTLTIAGNKRVCIESQGYIHACD